MLTVDFEKKLYYIALCSFGVEKKKDDIQFKKRMREEQRKQSIAEN